MRTLAGGGGRAEGAGLNGGDSKDQMVSVHNLGLRNRRKSARKRFDGHKGMIAANPESQLIAGADVLSGDTPDRE